NTFVGNVMTSRVNRDRLEFHGSSPRAIEQDDFVKTEDPWFRPVDQQLGPDGAFYVADFYNRIIGHYEVPLEHPGRDRERGRIWRIVYRGTGVPPLSEQSDLSKKGTAGIIAELASPNITRRMLAMNYLVDNAGPSAVEPLRKILTAPAKPFQKAHALWI